MTPFNLRPYQQKIIDEVRAKMLAGCHSIIIQAPTGAGKTALAAKMMGGAAAKNMAGIFLVHRRELVRQTIKAFGRVGIRHGLIAAGFMEDRGQPIQVGSVQTYSRRLSRYQQPRLVLWDECHHIAAESWSAIHRSLPDAFHIGLTATPERMDGAGLGRWFGEMVSGPSVAWLIENGWLSPYKLVVPPGVSVAGVHSRMGDYVRSELASAADKPTITGDAIREYRRHCRGARAVAFCVSVNHSKHVAQQFNAAGIAAEHVDGETPTGERDDAIARFESGDIRVLCNVDLFGEGFDLPAIEACILLRPTQSLAIHLQQVGRSLRPSPGKDYAVILDHAGNCGRHGLPDDERAWSLEGRSSKGTRSEGGGKAPYKVCQKCFAKGQLNVVACTFCGYVNEARGEGQQIAHVEGDLVEVEPAIMRQHRALEQLEAKSLDDLVALAKRRGYQQPRRWATNVHRSRQRQQGAAGGR